MERLDTPSPAFSLLGRKRNLDRNMSLLLVVVLGVSSVHGWLPAVSTRLSSSTRTTSVPGSSLAKTANFCVRTSIQTKLEATVESEQGLASAFSSDDNRDESVKITSLENSLIVKKNGISTVKSLKKSRNTRKNTAMNDPQFLRKRTTDLLKVTEYALEKSTGTTQQQPEQASLGRHMKVEKKTFHFLLDAWAFSGELDAADQAQQLLQRMEDLGQHNKSLAPDVRSYTKTINAIARQAALTAGDEAEAILAKMKDLCKAALPTNPEAAAAVKPNSYTYTAVIQAHANSGAPGSAERAEQLTEKMIDKYQRGDDEVKPTAKAFNAVIHAYGKAGNAEKAESVFNRMEQLYEAGVAEAKPNSVNYNALISAWANCDSQVSAQRAEEVLERMEHLYRSGDKDVRPTTLSYNAVIDAFAKSGAEDAAQKAEELLRHMGELYEAGTLDAKPNTRSFNSVMNAWAKSRHEDAALNAAELLDLMEKLYEEGDKEVRPDVHSFCTVINAYARSSMPDKADRAYNLYHEMKKLYLAGNKHVRPNVVAVNAVMNACAFTTGELREQNRAVEIAHSILKDLEQSPYGSSDQVTYGTFMKVCANQMPDSDTRQQIVEVLFKKCCRDGQVGNLVLQQLRCMATDELHQKLVGCSIHDTVQIEDLPKEWWSNVKEGKWKRRRI